MHGVIIVVILVQS